jgi:hypothetical protein
VPIAGSASESEILDQCSAAMLAGGNVIQRKREIRKTLRSMAILA